MDVRVKVWRCEICVNRWHWVILLDGWPWASSHGQPAKPKHKALGAARRAVADLLSSLVRERGK